MPPSSGDESAFEELWREVAAEMRMTAAMTGKSALSPEVVGALRAVPRERFVPPEQASFAFGNYPLSIGYGQTISQPYIVALMTELLECQPTHRILEVGTGSGYQAAILSLLVRHVYTIEIIPGLGEQAHRRFSHLGYHNISVRVGDGYHGWTEEAPFDGIIVTAATPEIPPPLIAQLKPGGRMVIPVGGSHFDGQDLVVLTKDAEGEVTSKSVLAVAFVPLTGRHGALDTVI